MKKFIMLSVAAITLIPTISFANITCNAVVFDIALYPNVTNFEIKSEESGNWITFRSARDNVQFNVVVNKETEEVNGSISYLTNGNEDFSKGSVRFGGGFSKKGDYNFITMRGGNLMMPQTYEAVTCTK